MSTIVKLEAENVKRLQAVSISPDGKPVVIVGGKNAQGKSSLLDSIEYALGGKPNAEEPIRKGQDKARIVLETEELVVTRRFTKKGSYINVEKKECGTLKSPQAILDDLVGPLSFDPLEFARMGNSKEGQRQQARTLRELVGVDTTQLDIDYGERYDERTVVNRQVKDMAAQIDAIPEDDVKAVSVTDLLAELEKRQAFNDELDDKLQDADREAELAGQAITDHERTLEEIKGIEAHIEQLKKDIDVKWEFVKDREKAAEEHISKENEMRKQAASTESKDTQEIREQIQLAEVTNERAAQQQRRNELVDKHAGLQKKADTLTGDMEKIDKQKQELLASAKFPVEGLSFNEHGVTYNDVPFSQCSSAEQMRVSLAMGISLNPKLKVMLIRDGSLLDEDNLKMISDMSEEAGAQVWIERVSDGDEVSVIIEDGQVLEGKV